MIYITDFDYTLFDTSALVDHLASEFARFGIAPDQFHTAVAEVKKELGYYDYKKHLEKIVFGKDYEDALEVVDSVLSRASEYLYPDALPFLQRTHAAGHSIYVLTFGEDDWQRKKIIGTQIDGFVQVHTTTGSKVEALHSIGEHGQPMVLVEDSGPNIDSIKAAYPNVTAVWVRRPNGKYRNEPCHLADHEVADLSALPFAAPSV